MSTPESDNVDHEPDRPTIGLGDPTTFWVPGAIPSATVIIVRDSAGGRLETLMLQRDAGLTFAGGMWVFPGGRIDPEDMLPGDHEPRDNNDQTVEPAHATGSALEHGSRATALRETTEETGLIIDPGQLARWSHWTAPVETPRRFTTAFYVTVIDGDQPDVIIDDAEIRQFRWMSPAAVIAEHAANELGLTPPTFITLTELALYWTTAELLASISTRQVEHFATRFGFVGDQMIAMYHGDAGYDTNDVTVSGSRHRLVLGSPWVYERDS